MRLSEAARVLNAELRAGDAGARAADAEFTGVSTDSRTLARGDLFVALKGERYDGHAYVATVGAAGAAAAIVARGTSPAAADCPLLLVDDPERALAALAKDWRARFALPLVALTGSNGKTTVKEMLASILRTAAGDPSQVLATQGNLNNHIGVPLTLLRLRASHRYAVVEMGMNHAGEIRHLTQLAAPDVALVINAGTAHIEFLGSREAIARAKGELFEGLKADGTAVINADDTFAPLWRAAAGAHRRLEFSLDQTPPAAVHATCQLRDFDSELRLTTPLGSATAVVPAPGLHNVKNAVAASAAAAALKLAPGIIASGLATFTGAQGRLQRKAGADGAVVIDDTYNANPDSARAAISVLAAARGARVLVLGDMGELGPDGPALHAEVGEFARTAGVERLYTLGALSARATEAYGAGARHFERVDDLVAALRGACGAGTTVLVKGSRFMRMERVVAALTGDTGSGALMLLELFQFLAKDFRPFGVFQYITLRAVLACLTALVISFIVGPAMIRKLTHYKIGQAVRSDGPQSHLPKAGTPTMGGALILVSIVITTVLWADLENRFVWVVLAVTLGFGAIGWVDDYRKVVHRNPKGLSARAKFFWQSVIGVTAACVIATSTNLPAQTEFIVPFFKEIQYPLGVVGFVVMTYFVIVGTSNAVNLTDGLDGLAIMPTVMIGSALGVFAYVAGNKVYANYLLFPHIPGAAELTIVCGAIAGAGLAFLWFNAYPAEVFMGDVGALSLGAALGTIAVICRQEIVLFIMGGVFVVETLSVMIQVASFKLTGKRVFRMAPLHHHYELKGWKENQVVVRFWIITMMLVLIGLSTLKLR